ncbi:MAG: DUF5916 domain-containing protein [Bacteroidales bacterium]|nr:DUF5916 domain-containing protein [Bacteroidales bacterium]
MTRILTFLILIVIPFSAISQKKTYTTQKLHSKVPAIDGKFDDACWKEIEWAGDFTQFQPYEDTLPSQKTKFAILYDDNNLYVAIKSYDSEPDKINQRLSRRDAEDGDWAGIIIDSYEDKLTGFSFSVTAAGSKMDAIFTNDNSQDASWDPIWYVKTSTDAEGWNAEMRIPLSQLRFTKKNSYEWGVEVARFVFRKSELSLWEPLHKSANKTVSDFGTLGGIRDISPKKDIELIPFTLGKITYTEKEDGNPFITGRDNSLSAGLDGKISITNDLTLNLTVNPDFGQVEADPSQVNLSSFESFYPEKRPFFIEGRNIFDFRMTSGDGDGSAAGMFYSRRIGRSPHFAPDLNDNEYAKVPDNASILGAFKLSGKTRKGLSIGILESFTQRESADLEIQGVKSKYPVEPFTNYMVARVEQDINKGNSVIGGILTSTHREINSENFISLPSSAYTGGVNATHYWDNKNYFVTVRGIFSSIYGSKEAITELQTNSTHNFQRPDATHLKVDSTRTSLSGHGGTLEFGKFGGGHLRMLSWITWTSPGLDFNDLGFMQQSDNIQQVAWFGYNEWQPKHFYNSFNFGGDIYTGWNFAGQNIYKGLEMNGNLQFKNYYSVFSGFNLQGNSLSAYDLRGGPMLKSPPSFNFRIGFNSDERKKISMNLFLMKRWSEYNNSNMAEIEYELTYKPINTISISLSPSYLEARDNLQYVTTIEGDGTDKYVMGQLDSKQFSLAARINIGLTPDMSIQYYGQPFFFSGNYSHFKTITQPDSPDYNDRFHEYTADELISDSESGVYTIHTDGNTDYSFDNPNFHFLQYRSNLVYRWEYKPGSTVFLVWSQGRTTDGSDGNFMFGNYADELRNTHPQNDFLVKISYAIIF